jgi:hypothetical protein
MEEVERISPVDLTMINNKGYIITLRDAVVDDTKLKDLVSSKYYIQSQNLPLILYKDKEQMDEMDTAVCPAFRMHGFLILNFNKNEEDRITNFVKNRLSNDDFIKSTLNKCEIIDAESATYSKVVEKLIKEVNEILALKLEKKDILKMSEIKIMPKEEKMEIEKLVPNTVKGSLSYLLIKSGKLVDSKNISVPSEELNRFVLASRLSSVLLNNFPGNHRDLKDQKVATMVLHDKEGDKIILFKQFKDNYTLIFDCSESELEDAKQSIKDLDKKLSKGGSKDE